LAKKKAVTITDVFQRPPRCQPALRYVERQQQEQCLSGDHDGEAEPVSPLLEEFQNVLEREVAALLGPRAKRGQQNRHGQKQQRQRVKQNGQDGPAFHEI
jgi:hypothetical protein